VLQVLRDANAALLAAGRLDPLRRITVAGDGGGLVVTIAGGKILVAQIALGAQ
jgi:hypothetical protein